MIGKVGCKTRRREANLGSPDRGVKGGGYVKERFEDRHMWLLLPGYVCKQIYEAVTCTIGNKPRLVLA